MDPNKLKAEDFEGKSLIDMLEEIAVSESCKPGGMTYIRDALVKACAIYAAMTVEPGAREKFLDAIRKEIGTLGPVADKMREKLRRSVN
jgi:hypothetical protein